MGRFKIGDKVVPIDKTVNDYGELNDSIVWNKAKHDNQPYLYVAGFDDEEHAYVCSKYIIDDEIDGDFFNESDLIPYEEKGEM